MKCPKCGNENDDSAKFCKNCGNPLEAKAPTGKNNDKVILIALVAIVAILIVCVLAFSGGLFKSDVPLETTDFGGITMLTPVGSNYVETSSIPAFGSVGGFVQLENDGKYSREAYGIMFSTIQANTPPSQVSLDRQEGDITIYKDNEGGEGIYMTRNVDDVEVSLIGNDEDTLIKMLKSVKVTEDFSNEATTTTQSSQPASSSTPSSISILGGSFSTGSGEADKTYARINVGTAHAGEDVIVQIFYSRDGNSLNHGNMVPATVHQDGYLEIASADAYHYYPDFAEINIYDSNSHLLTSKSVSLSPSAGTQTF